MNIKYCQLIPFDFNENFQEELQGFIEGTDTYDNYTYSNTDSDGNSYGDGCCFVHAEFNSFEDISYLDRKNNKYRPLVFDIDNKGEFFSNCFGSRENKTDGYIFSEDAKTNEIVKKLLDSKK